ncbi:hypothetical protein D3C77_498590 [compost metagenome]
MYACGIDVKCLELLGDRLYGVPAEIKPFHFIELNRNAGEVRFGQQMTVVNGLQRRVETGLYDYALGVSLEAVVRASVFRHTVNVGFDYQARQVLNAQV